MSPLGHCPTPHGDGWRPSLLLEPVEGWPVGPRADLSRSTDPGGSPEVPLACAIQDVSKVPARPHVPQVRLGQAGEGQAEVTGISGGHQAAWHMENKDLTLSPLGHSACPPRPCSPLLNPWGECPSSGWEQDQHSQFYGAPLLICGAWPGAERALGARAQPSGSSCHLEPPQGCSAVQGCSQLASCQWHRFRYLLIPASPREGLQFDPHSFPPATGTPGLPHLGGGSPLSCTERVSPCPQGSGHTPAGQGDWLRFLWRCAQQGQQRPRLAAAG